MTRPGFLRAGALALAGLALNVPIAAQETRGSRPGAYSGWSPVLYDGYEQTSRYVAMRDGTRIAVDLYRPTLGGQPVADKLPVLWMNDPYNRRIHEGKPAGEHYPGAALALVKYGYVVAIADMRGNFASFGMAMHSNRNQWMPWAYWDAYDITEWLAAQPWSDGKIGMWGCSATGHSQWQAAATKPPHLKAIFPMSSPSEYYDWGGITPILANPQVSQPYPGTVPEADAGAVAVDEDSDGSLLAAAKQDHRRNLDYGYAPYRDSTSPEASAHLGMKEFKPWQQVSTFANFDKINASGIPAYQTANYGEDIRVKEGIFVKRANIKLPLKTMIAPGNHCEWTSDFEVPKSNTFNINTEELRWFDYWLKGKQNGIMDEPPILYYTIHGQSGDSWRQAWQWPLPNQARKSFWFAAGPSAREGSLSLGAPVAGSAGDEYRVDYSASTADLDSKGQIYTSAPVDADTTMTGHAIVDLWIKSSASDGDFIVWIEDVAPDGSVTRLPGTEDGRLRASHRALGKPGYDNLDLPYHRSFKADVRPLVPGEPARLAFAMAPVSWVFRKGHQIRIAIVCVAASRRGGAGATPVLDPVPVVTFMRDAAHPSRIELPFEAPVVASATARKVGAGYEVRLVFPASLDPRYVGDVQPEAILLGDQPAVSLQVSGRSLMARFVTAPASGTIVVSGKFGGKYNYGSGARFSATVGAAK